MNRRIAKKIYRTPLGLQRARYTKDQRREATRKYIASRGASWGFRQALRDALSLIRWAVEEAS